MFWKFGFHTPSAIDAKLDKPDVTLEDLFDDEDLIQECKGHNRKLVDFLMKAETISQVLHYALVGASLGNETPEEFESEQNLKQRKYSYLACEIICCELSFIMDEISTEQNLEKIFDFSNKPARHNFLLSNHFNRIVVVLSSRKPFEVAEFFSLHETALTDLLKTMHIFQVSELLPKIANIQADVTIAELFKKLAIVESLVANFAASTNPEEIVNISSVLLDILNTTSSAENSSRAIVSNILGGDTLTKLFSSVYQLNDLSKLKSGLPVLTKLIEYGSGLFNSSSDKSVIAALTPILKEQIPNISKIFTDYKTSPASLPVGKSESLVGLERVLLVAHVQAVVSIGDAELIDIIISNGVIVNILDIFFNYPYHNIFHGHAFKLFLGIIEGSSDALTRELFGKGNLLVRIRTNYTVEAGSSKRDTFDFCHRGFLTKLGNKVLEFSCKFLSYIDSDWTQFVQEKLSPQNTRESSPTKIEESSSKSAFEAAFEIHTTSSKSNFDDDDDDDELGDDDDDDEVLIHPTPTSSDPLGLFNPGGQTSHFDANFDANFDAEFDGKFEADFSSFPDNGNKLASDADLSGEAEPFEANFEANFEASFESAPVPFGVPFVDSNAAAEVSLESQSGSGSQSTLALADQANPSVESVQEGIAHVAVGEASVVSEPVASGASLEPESDASN